MALCTVVLGCGDIYVVRPDRSCGSCNQIGSVRVVGDIEECKALCKTDCNGATYYSDKRCKIWDSSVDDVDEPGSVFISHFISGQWLLFVITAERNSIEGIDLQRL